MIAEKRKLFFSFLFVLKVRLMQILNISTVQKRAFTVPRHF